MRLGRPRNTASLMLASHVLEATMKKMVFIACALMLIAAGSAMAGVNLAWNDCLGGGGLSVRTNTCANTGGGTLFLSFTPDADIPMLQTSDTFTDVEAAVSVNNWWTTAVTGTRW